jgi:uncharacterized membrane protein YbaN (DUF454 family)
VTSETEGDPPTQSPARPAVIVRALWAGLGLICVAIGSVGVIVPGLPTTIFFIGAAACFTRSSPRLERWVLGLPGVGPAVADYRAGLGMPRRAKFVAVGMIVVFSTVALLVLNSTVLRVVVAVAALIGIGMVTLRVPTRERVLRDTGHETPEG